jgi:predicted DNA-binding transcriptional regulator YafY
MTVWYSHRIARWIAEREGCTLSDDGSLTLEHPLADEEWAVRHVLQYGPDAEVLHPPELRALLARRLAEMAADQGRTYP